MSNIVIFLFSKLCLILLLQGSQLYSSAILPETLHEKYIHDPKVPGLVVNTNLAIENKIHGFFIDMDGPTRKNDERHLKSLFFGQARVFTKIPYVQPIDASRRFLKAIPWRTSPRSVALEKKLLDELNNRTEEEAKKFGPSCKNYRESDSSEDCLTINVFAPPKKGNNTYPVYVHIHGGALVQGSATEHGYKGLIRNLVSRGIIVVTFNYRLSAYGFLEVFNKEELKMLREKHKKEHPGKPFPYEDYRINLGLEDAIMALQWVKENISNFGGDIDRITLGGNSAGASMTVFLALELNREGSTLGQKVKFNQIAPFGSSADVCTKYSWLGQDLDTLRKTEAHCHGKTGEELWDCLKNVDFAALDTASITITPKQHLIWGVKPDVEHFPDVARGMFKLQAHEPKQKLKVFYAMSRDEWATFDSIDFRKEAQDHGIKTYGRDYLKLILKIILKSYEMIKEPLDAKAEEIANKLVDIYRTDFKVDSNVKNEEIENTVYYQIITRIITDKIWAISMLHDALELAEKWHKVFMLKFSHLQVHRIKRENPFQDETVRVVEHGQETRYAVMHEKHWVEPKRNLRNVHELAVAEKMGQLLANFIIYGNPQHLSCLAKEQAAIPKDMSCISSNFGVDNGPYFSELTSVHPKTDSDHILVNVQEKTDWIKRDVVNHWCRLYQSHGHAPFTVAELKNQKKETNYQSKMCA